MGDKIVSINGRSSIDETNGNVIDPEFVDMMERFLVKVRTGEVTSLYATGFTSDGGTFNLSWFGDDNLYESVGIIEAMKAHFLRASAKEGDQE